MTSRERPAKSRAKAAPGLTKRSKIFVAGRARTTLDYKINELWWQRARTSPLLKQALAGCDWRGLSLPDKGLSRAEGARAPEASPGLTKQSNIFVDKRRANVKAGFNCRDCRRGRGRLRQWGRTSTLEAGPSRT